MAEEMDGTTGLAGITDYHACELCTVIAVLAFEMHTK